MARKLVTFGLMGVFGMAVATCSFVALKETPLAKGDFKGVRFATRWEPVRHMPQFGKREKAEAVSFAEGVALGIQEASVTAISGAYLYNMGLIGGGDRWRGYVAGRICMDWAIEANAQRPEPLPNMDSARAAFTRCLHPYGLAVRYRPDYFTAADRHMRELDRFFTLYAQTLGNEAGSALSLTDATAPQLVASFGTARKTLRGKMRSAMGGDLGAAMARFCYTKEMEHAKRWFDTREQQLRNFRKDQRLLPFDVKGAGLKAAAACATLQGRFAAYRPAPPAK